MTGEPLDPEDLPERIQLFSSEGDPLSIPIGHRRVAEFTTDILGPAEDTGKLETREPGEGESGTAAIGAGVLLTKIQVSRPARVRLYTSMSKRDADVDRDRFTDPMDYPEPNLTPDHGCLAEFLFLSFLSIENIPSDYLFTAAADADISYRVDNYDLTAGPVTVTLTIKDVEQ